MSIHPSPCPLLMLLISVAFATPAPAADPLLEGRTRREACTDRDVLRRPFFGDLHVHTTFSLDTCETHGPDLRSLCSVWRDPDFDPADSAFYYARVIENPTCRWSQKLCVAAGVRRDDAATIREGLEPCCVAEHRRVVQERAWTSPIWYRPATP